MLRTILLNSSWSHNWQWIKTNDWVVLERQADL